MPRLVRRKPLVDRMKDFLNPGDFLLWLSEEIETRDWDNKHVATPLAFGLHVTLLIAKANSGVSGRSRGDDVFGDDNSGSGWLNYIASFIVYILTFFSITNAAYTFLRKRHYRLFESSIDAPQNTPSAHRVRVDSSPVSSSPLQFFTSILGDASSESRAHPDPARDVWELAVWDPLPVCLRLFCLFSPGHVFVYWLFLPTLSSDPRPSMTVFTTLLLEILLSSQLLLLQSTFSQQEKDSAIISKEVMSEYDIKYVHPRLNPLARDVGTQFTGPGSERSNDVDTYTPTIIIKREFRTNPNPNYAKHIDPDSSTNISRQVFSPATGYTPSAYNSREPTPIGGFTPRPPIRQPQFRQSMGGAVSTTTSTGDGGSLGVYSHANSPLKKATSMYDIQGNGRQMPRSSFDMAAREIQEQRERSKSPAKRQSDAPMSILEKGRPVDLELENDRRASGPSAFGAKPRPRPYDSPYKRGPSRF